MSNSTRQVGPNAKSAAFQRHLCFRHGRRRNNLVHIPVQQEYRRSRLAFDFQTVRLKQPTGCGNNASKRISATRPDMQRHHRTLREPKQYSPRRFDACGRDLVVYKVVEAGIRQFKGKLHFRLRASIELRHGKPLKPSGIHCAGFGGIRSNELRGRTFIRKRFAQPHQVGSICSITVKEYDETVCETRLCLSFEELQIRTQRTPSLFFANR